MLLTYGTDSRLEEGSGMLMKHRQGGLVETVSVIIKAVPAKDAVAAARPRFISVEDRPWSGLLMAEMRHRRDALLFLCGGWISWQS